MSEIFEEVCPQYLVMGMTYTEFWDGDAAAVRAYRKANDLRLSEKNETAWLYGLYNYNAFSSVMGQFAYGLGGRKGKRPEGYRDSPLPLTDMEKEREEKKKIEHTLKFFEDGQKK